MALRVNAHQWYMPLFGVRMLDDVVATANLIDEGGPRIWRRRPVGPSAMANCAGAAFWKPGDTEIPHAGVDQPPAEAPVKVGAALDAPRGVAASVRIEKMGTEPPL